MSATRLSVCYATLFSHFFIYATAIVIRCVWRCLCRKYADKNRRFGHYRYSLSLFIHSQTTLNIFYIRKTRRSTIIHLSDYNYLNIHVVTKFGHVVTKLGVALLVYGCGGLPGCIKLKYSSVVAAGAGDAGLKWCTCFSMPCLLYVFSVVLIIVLSQCGEHKCMLTSNYFTDDKVTRVVYKCETYWKVASVWTCETKIKRKKALRLVTFKELILIHTKSILAYA